MSRTIRVVALLTGLGAPGLLALAVGAAAGPPQAEPTPAPDARVRPEARLVPQRQWEYVQLPCLPAATAVREEGELADKLNDLGRRGWELVSLVHLQSPGGRDCVLATLKRQRLN